MNHSAMFPAAKALTIACLAGVLAIACCHAVAAGQAEEFQVSTANVMANEDSYAVKAFKVSGANKPASWPTATGSLRCVQFRVPFATDSPDFDCHSDLGIVTGLVGNWLGPNGFPVRTTFAATRTDGSGPIMDIYHPTQEILWWSTASPYGIQPVSYGTTESPFNLTWGPLDDGWRSMHWQGRFGLKVPATAKLTLYANDDAWIFIDGALAVDDGGVKRDDPEVTIGLSKGEHKIDIFYADRSLPDASIYFTAVFTDLKGNTLCVRFRPSPARAIPIELASASVKGARSSSHRVTRVGVFSTVAVDARQIDPSTVALEGVKPVSWVIKDLNKDRRPDLLLEFDAQALQSEVPGDEVWLTALTWDGCPVEGCGPLNGP